MRSESEAAESAQSSHIRVPLYFCLGTLITGLLLLYSGRNHITFDYTQPPADSLDLYLDWGAFWSGLCLLVIGVVGILLARFWWKAWGKEPPSSFHPKTVYSSRYWWLALATCILLGGALRIPLLEHSFWWDETWGVKRVIAGEWQDTGEATLSLEKPSWQDTLFHFSKPTNHVTYSILSRIGHEIWLGLGGTGVAEWVIRLPALLFGLALIWLGADLCRRWGFPLAGLLFALLIALHPWFIRYSVDARAYTLIALLSLLLLANGLSLIKSNRRRRWLSYALILAFAIWSFPFIFFFAAPLSIGVLLIGTRYPETTGLRPSVFFLRWLSTHALALVLVLPLVAPLIPQIGYWDAESRNHATLDYGAFLPRLYAEYALGMPWDATTDEPDVVRPSLTNHAIFGAQFYALNMIPLFALTGLLFLYLSCKRFFLLVIIGFAAVVLTILLSWFSHTFLYSRFLIFGAVLFCCCLAIGVEGLVRLMYRYLGTTTAVLFALLFLVATALYTEPQRELFQRYAFAPVRETAQIVQQWQQKFPDLLVLAYYPTWDSISVYYPAVVPIYSLEELDMMEIVALQQGRPMLFVVELRDFLLFPQPALQTRLFHSTHYTEEYRLVGSDLNSSHLILFYQPQ